MLDMLAYWRARTAVEPLSTQAEENACHRCDFRSKKPSVVQVGELEISVSIVYISYSETAVAPA